ncbi:tetratricopeptide repeat protein [Nocardia sp. CDC153]|uniref:serine/threonine-protein kinase n=1 Tax=Nocardia sp. CDC153 TaxID=3112167 RepID=UPI002DBE8547|nr:tetratricopeptide repeat protein [Nocardia sp. CDC153]MEC3953716.1 tetratricopeptide repeat protein [Nocardia sp. CDC153]
MPDISVTSGPVAQRGAEVTSAVAGVGIGGERTVVSARAARFRAVRQQLGTGMVPLPTVPTIDPAAAVPVDPEVPQDKRFCWKCRHPVGRAADAGPTGNCERCGTRFNFRPPLRPGTVVADQYDVHGCLAYGGMGWIYLARDRNVSRRWVVLKGLQNPGDMEARIVAVAERQFLSELAHPSIVKIFNFVQHRSEDGVVAGYIVMEYIGGQSLRALLDALAPERFSVAEALACVMEVLPALDYLHGLGLGYNDVKPDNIMVGDGEVRLIDLGAVAALGSGGSLYGTVGYQAPEYTETGPSVAADIYAVGRTLAALTLPMSLDRHGNRLPGLPSPDRASALRRYPAFHRLLVRATDPDPAQRFSSIYDMYCQAAGVLRAVLAADTGRGIPQISTVFGSARADFGTEVLLLPTDGLSDGVARRPLLRSPDVVAALAVPLIDPDDPSAELVSPLLHEDPERVLDMLRVYRESAAAGVLTLPASFAHEAALAEVRAQLDLGKLAGARETMARLDGTAAETDWRLDWYRAVADLLEGRYASAYELFDAVRGALPGEIAPMMALGAAAELQAQADLLTQDEVESRWRATAREHYRAVWAIDRGMESAAFGVARCRTEAGDLDHAVAMLASVPPTSGLAELAGMTAALLAVSRPPTELRARHVRRAAECLEALADGPRVRQLRVIVLSAALAALRCGALTDATDRPVLGYPTTERGLRRGVEAALRAVAWTATRPQHRFDLIDLANRVRPWSWF